jgi:hypothetical protein
LSLTKNLAGYRVKIVNLFRKKRDNHRFSAWNVAWKVVEGHAIWGHDHVPVLSTVISHKVMASFWNKNRISVVQNININFLLW